MTAPEATRFGASAGSVEITSTTTPLSAGVDGPQAGVYSVVWPRTTPPFRSSWRRWPVPRHVPSKLTWATVNAPAAEMPRLERELTGADSSAPLRIRMPAGLPGLGVKKSPLTPTAVVEAAASCSMLVSFCVATIAPLESAGESV